MEYYRLYQHLTKGQNIKHLDKELDIVRDRFDNNLFDILAAKEVTWVGIYLSEHSDETRHKLEQSAPWREKHEAEVYVVTESPEDFPDVDRVISYTYRNGHHFDAQRTNVLEKMRKTGIPELLVDYLTTKLEPPEAKFARELCKRLLQENT